MTDREAIANLTYYRNAWVGIQYGNNGEAKPWISGVLEEAMEMGATALQEREERSKEGKSLREKIERYKIESGFVSANPEERAMFAESLIDTLKSLDIPTIDAVPRTVYDQCAWERDLAIQQLREDYGVGLGEKKKVVHGRWKNGVCPVCGFDIRCLAGENDLEQWVWVEGFNYCPNCGAKMDLED